MDHELEHKVMQLMNAASFALPATAELSKLVVFRECWAIADHGMKLAFAKSVLEATAKGLDSDKYELAKAATKLVSEEILSTPEAKVALAAAVLAKAVELVGASDNRYDSRNGELFAAVQSVARKAVDTIAPEQAGAIEAKLREHVTAAMLDQAVQSAANSMAFELRRKVEEAAKAEALPATPEEF
jgi:hypothetical protein